ncbi:aminotransferase class V-fold PLP-dependent enzyme [Sphingosinicella sp. LHD-64]|uniref:cysteine desulfurase family protein n=1 Tax=Sphingosinicella sp. LHD-64 TaxID=3072139 RepID=UPI00280CCFA2|nr:aminotransferase class V-fold PLP-dependent enzyme [Sphingosinicella sp. LHD-64]MDQ8754990.1 aminotransferase class V-fold PLP-dependent enzyme [Sphingosinicella sp. LHD-64]
MLYLDYQATTSLAPEALEAMLPWLGGPGSDGYANPSSQYRAGRAAAAAVEVARDQVAALLPAGGQVHFTSGATEALNWALMCGTRLAPGGVAGSAIEHHAALQCLESMGATLIPVGPDGLVPPVDEVALLEGGIVALMLVNNEVGTVQPVADYAVAAHARGSLLLCDAVQGYGRIAIPEGPDLIAISAHKIHGPKGIGALWVRDGVRLPPLLLGGGQEHGMRSGTVSPALVAGFGAAARLAAERREADAAHVARLWDMALELLDGWTVNGSVAQRYRGNLNVRRAGVTGVRLLSDVRQVAFSLGSACGSGSGKTSHVLRAMGLTEAEAHASIRLGFGRYTTEAELREALGLITEAADRQLRFAA